MQFLLTFNLFFYLFDVVSSHARLIEPPSRTSAWRFGFGTPSMYNDHETNCGGFGRQWTKNKGKCGICGDPWDSPSPRDGESGGKFGRGVIVRSYPRSQNIRIRVDVTVNHKGYFEFHLCSAPETEGCLIKKALQLADGSTKHFVSPGTGTHSMEVRTLRRFLET